LPLLYRLITGVPSEKFWLICIVELQNK